MALPKSSDDYFYYIFIMCGIFVSLSILIIGNIVWLKYYFNLNLSYNNVLSYMQYLYNIFKNFSPNVATLYFQSLTICFSFSIYIFFVKKNPFTLSLQYSQFAQFQHIKKMSPNVLASNGFALGSFNLGVFKKIILKTNEPLALLCVAPAGAGKTSGCVIPTILSCDRDCLIINDPKGELYDITHKYRSKIGNVFKMEWSLPQNQHNETTTFFNPLDYNNLPPDTANRGKAIDTIVNILIKETKGDAFWTNSARKTLGAIILYGIYKNELQQQTFSIADAKDILATIGIKKESDEEGEDEEDYGNAESIQIGFIKLSKEIKTLSLPQVIIDRCYNIFAENASTSPNTLGSILATISASLVVFNNENVRLITSKNTFCLNDIRGINNKPLSIYLISPAAEQELFGVLSAIFVELAYKFITSQDLKEIKTKPIVRFILDEVAFFPKISAIIDGPAIARGYRGSFLFVCQDLSQIIDKYGAPSLNTMFTNTAFKIILPQNNDETAKRLASLGGQRQVKITRGSGKNKSTNKELQSLITPSDVMSLPSGKQIVFVQNNAKTPIICNIPFFFKNKEMLKKLKD